MPSKIGKGQGRPVGYEVGPETREAIAEYRRGKKWDEDTKKKIGKGVRKGRVNKVPFNTRIDPASVADLRKKSKKARLPMAAAVEAAIAAWSP